VGFQLQLLDSRSARAEEIWRALERQAAVPYFLTWAWIGNWLASLPAHDVPSLAVLLSSGVPAAALFLGRRRQLRYLAFPSRALFLNATGCARWDELSIEHNAVICAPGARPSLSDLLEALPGKWDELMLPGVARDRFPGNALDGPLPGYVVRIDGERPSPYVDLAKVRAAEGGYLSLLGAGTRAQIRRAERGFGTIRVEVASDARQAAEVFRELVELHTRGWRARGRPGAFADPWFEAFHRRLVDERAGTGEIQLVRLRAGGITIGCLYNLVSSGRVLFYQSGFARFDDPRLKSGYLCHVEAVRHNAAAGHAVYDLLAGDARYKRSLATDEGRLAWARVQRPLLRFRLEEALRRWKRRVRGAAPSREGS
jgi:CelD/BcsL family acetyltransferase involved in cellulose biosynthesis